MLTPVPFWQWLLIVAPLIIGMVHFWRQAHKHRADAERFRETIIHKDFPTQCDALVSLVFRNAKEKGFWPSGRNKGEAIALIHEEASELLTAVRTQKGPHADHGELEELSDIIIRCMDYAGGWHADCSLGDAIVAKMHKNLKRPAKHGKAF